MADNNKGTGGFCGMLLIGVVAFGLFIGMFWAILDGANVDYIAPMPTPYHNDTTSDILTIVEPITITAEMEQVAIADEITDLARDVSDNQLAQANNANGAIAAVGVAGLASNTAIVTSFNARDVFLAMCVVVALFLWWQVQKARNEKRQ